MQNKLGVNLPNYCYGLLILLFSACGTATDRNHNETEHIDFLSCRYNCDGVYMLTLKTNLGQSIVVEGDAGNEEEDEEEEGEECH